VSLDQLASLFSYGGSARGGRPTTTVSHPSHILLIINATRFSKIFNSARVGN